MRLIDADALIEDILALPNCPNGFSDTYDKSCIIGVIDEQPTIEPKKGKWIIDGECVDCSVCRHDKWSRVPFEDLVKRFNFCPNCGADMRGDKE